MPATASGLPICGNAESVQQLREFRPFLEGLQFAQEQKFRFKNLIGLRQRSRYFDSTVYIAEHGPDRNFDLWVQRRFC